MRQDEKFIIEEIGRDGLPSKPRKAKDAFSAQCGVVVRDMIPISIHLWYKPKNEHPQVSYVNYMQKNDLWTALKANFTLPPKEDPEKQPPVIEQLVKEATLKKIRELSRTWKNELNAKFVEKTRLQNSPAGLRRSEITGTHLWPTRNRKRVSRCQRETR